MTKSNSEDTEWDPWRTYAEKKGVSTKTLDRWVEAGILQPPKIIRGRKYQNRNVEPRRDGGEAT